MTMTLQHHDALLGKGSTSHGKESRAMFRRALLAYVPAACALAALPALNAYVSAEEPEHP
jgi:hypothetical protein